MTTINRHVVLCAPSRACADCGYSTYAGPCPGCGKVVCQRCAEAEGAFCGCITAEEPRCLDCGERGERTGHQTCQYPGRHSDKATRGAP